MNRYVKYILGVVVMITAVMTTTGAEAANADITEKRQHVVRKDSVELRIEHPEDMVIVGNDTVSMIIPEKNYGRYDRGLYNYLYIPHDSWAFGLTASYGNINTEDVKVLSILDNVDFSGKIYTINPSVSYFIKHNQSIGIRFVYTHGIADLSNINVDIDDDMDFSLHDVNYSTNSSKIGVFYRNYVGLNHEKRFAVFNEVALDMGMGSSRFKRYYDGELYDTRTTIRGLNLNFSPGLCIFIQDYVAFNVSFGVFGLRLEKEKQETNGTNEGSRISSGANFRFNIFNINFGLLVVI